MKLAIDHTRKRIEYNKLYESGMSVLDISDKVQVTDSAIRHLLRRYRKENNLPIGNDLIMKWSAAN